ncbi:MAG: DUF805 domain-containing protein [Angelakisella sp.]|jgi:uncharacterized membrane protein YhaH (DUF805 family)|nr:DUF805 domain-containing protein [Angelakisella sp.]
MNQIIESYVDVWVNWKNFSGRTRRSAYWYAVLANMIIAFILGFVGGMLNLDIIGELYSLVFLIPSIALCVRRLHDTGHSGWWYLIVLTGIGAILLLVWFLQDSQPDNQYGPSPKGYSAAPMGYGAPQGGYQAPQTPPYQGPQNNGGNQYNGPEL